MRDRYYDVVKAAAMYMVVFWHFMEARPHEGNVWVANAIVGVNMPIFFALSGFFSRKMLDARDWRKLVRHVVSWVSPLIAISLLYAVVEVVFGINRWSFPELVLRKILFGPWFIWSLAITTLLAFLISIPAGWKGKLCAMAGVMALLMSLRNAWWMNSVRNMLPHYLFGAWVLASWPIWKKRFVWLPCALVYAAVVLTEGDVHANGMGFYWSDSTWWGVLGSVRGAVTFCARPVLGMVGTVAFFGVIHEMIHGLPWTAAIAPIGQVTLGVYLLHQWIIGRADELGMLPVSWLWQLVGAALLLLGCSGIVALSKRSKWCNRIVWGNWRA